MLLLYVGYHLYKRRQSRVAAASQSKKLLDQMQKAPKKTWVELMNSHKNKPDCTECAICLAEYSESDHVCQL